MQIFFNFVGVESGTSRQSRRRRSCSGETLSRKVTENNFLGRLIGRYLGKR